MLGTDNHFCDRKKGISMIKTSLHIFPIPWTKKWLVNADELIQDCSQRPSEREYSGQFSAYSRQIILSFVYTKLKRMNFLITRDFPVSRNHCE